MNKRRRKRARQGKKRGFPIKMQKKLLVLYALILLAFVVLSGRLVWIIRENETKYQKQVLSQQRYSSTVIPFRRGNIVDAKGTRLATSEKVYNLVIDAKVMTSKLKGEAIYLEPTLTALGEHFDLDMGKIREYVTTNSNSSWYVPLKRLTYDEISGFKEAMEEKDSYINGVWFEEEYKRTYPYGSLASDLIGFTTTDSQGSYGLEEYYNDILNGINGREYGYLNDDLALERTVKSAVDGYNIHTTIDANLQMIVEKNLKKFNEENKNKSREGNGAENVGCVMMDVNTGEVLAMASYPDYDLNDTRNPEALIGSRMVEQITNAAGYYEIKKTNTVLNEENIAAMDDDQLYVNLNYLWKNFCITETYEPGSTAKPFTVAAALEQACAHMAENAQKVSALRNQLIEGLSRIPGTVLNGDSENRLPGNVNLSFEGIEGESLVLLLDQQGICASTGSACTSHSLLPSHVLLATGQTCEMAASALRLSLNKNNTQADVDEVLRVTPRLVKELREKRAARFFRSQI